MPVLYQALVYHGVGYLEKARYVRTRHVVALHAVLLGVGKTAAVNVVHNALQVGIHFFARPVHTHAVLRHF